MKKIKNSIKYATVITILFATTMIANATTLPNKVLETIKSNLPNANVRFDGLVTTSNGTVFLPVLPSNPKREYEGKVVLTYPANKKLVDLPEVILFDNDLALLKVIKTNNGLSITDPKNIPFVVKTGLFPQDMLVPAGLVIPDELQIMMGDLKIATQSTKIHDIFEKADEINKGFVDTKFTPVKELKDKTLLITSIDTKIMSVVPTNSTMPKFTLTLESMPKFVQPVCDGKYILVAAAGKTYIDVADVKQEVIAKKIDLSYNPSEILITSDKTKAIVSVSNDQSLFIIDLKDMTLLSKIKVKGYPKNIALSADNNTIVYQDKNTGDIYTLGLNEIYTNKFIYNASNISKLLIKDKTLYILSRAENALKVIDMPSREIIYKQAVAEKPVDMLLIGDKLYILSADNQIDTFNLKDFSLEKLVKFEAEGFTKKLIKLENSNLFVITNVSEKSYYVYDYVQNKLIHTVQTPVYVNDLQILDTTLK